MAREVDGRWIPVGDIASVPGLAPEQRVALLAAALEELAVAEALIMIHGPVRGLTRYAELGGHVRVDPRGSAVIWSAQ